MTTRTITSLYDYFDDAARTVRDLEAADIPHDNVSVVANNIERLRTPPVAPPDAASVAEAGASIGTVIGGGAGLLAALGAVAIPGVGPVVAAGWLASTLAGAAAGAGVGAASGGVIGAMTEAGVSAEHAHVYAEGVRRGGTLVTVRVDDTSVAVVEQIMRQHHSIDPSVRATAYRQTGWKEFDETAPIFAGEELERERAHFLRDHAA